jgi:hypothetical protein
MGTDDEKGWAWRDRRHNPMLRRVVELEKRMTHVLQLLEGYIDVDGRARPGVVRTLDSLERGVRWLGYVGTAAVVAIVSDIIAQVHR